MNPERRQWLRSAAMLPLAGSVLARGVDDVLPSAVAELRLPTPTGAPTDIATHETYWSEIATLYDRVDDVAMLENGYWGAMARPVLQAYQRATADINRQNAWYGRRRFPADFETARARTAKAMGVGIDEIMLTRGATEALQALIGGYNRLRPGDAVLYADVDYDSMITAMQWLRQRRGVEVHAIAIPEPATHQGILDTYAKAFDAHRNLRLLLLTQVSHRNGLQLPIAEICEMARQRGIDVIVDAAHGFGQLDYRLPELKADFVGINLHKWVGAPVGVGALYIRRGRVPDIDPFMGESGAADDVRIRVHTGTANFAAFQVLPEALDLHERIGVAHKQARLQHLRNRWTDAVRTLDGIDLLTSPDPRLTSAIGAFRLSGKTKLEDNIALSKRLVKDFGVFTIHRSGLASGACVRVTPSIFTPEMHIDRLIDALRSIARA